MSTVGVVGAAKTAVETLGREAGAAEWIAKLEAAIRSRDWVKVGNFARNLGTAIKNNPSAARRFVQQISNLPRLMEEAGYTAEEVAEIQALLSAPELAGAGPGLAGAAAIPSTWICLLAVVLVVLVIWYFTPPSPAAERPKDMLTKVRPHLDPVSEEKNVRRKLVQEIRKHCRCSKGQAPLGSHFAGQQLAFQNNPISMPGGSAGGATGTPVGGTGAGGHGASGGQPDPFSFPTKGGVPAGVPGGHGNHPVLPNFKPVGHCIWPICRKMARAA